MEKLHVSQEGLDNLKADLAACKKRSLQVADAIEQARELGDLRENADYHAAKEEQALLHARIREIEHNIARASVLDEDAIDASKAYIGATVTVLNKKTNKSSTYTLVSPVEADMAHGRISVRSPVGEALLGKSVGDSALAKIPAGTVEFEILEISRS
ncbi:MAG: transcription elongation factor GreA [Candidatus Hydrogenedentes bacterium]|nr:transcription elongation factor GreA [Candidatus Hydrogenedentota bacterium]